MSKFRLTVAALIVATTTGLLSVASVGGASAAPAAPRGPHLCC